MSRPPPPPTFPMPNVSRSSASGYAPPPGSVHPLQTQTYNHGINPPQQPTTYATPQPPQPPPAHRTRDPYANTHTPAPTYSHSSSTPHPSTHLPSSGLPQAPPSMPIPSVPGYGASTNFSGTPPSAMMPRVATIPTPGQAHNPHPVPYHNVPAPVINHQPSRSGMSGGTRSVTGDWSHHGQSYSQNEDLRQRPEAPSHMTGDYSRERAPPTYPQASKGRLPQCKYCEKEIPRATYESFGGFCKQKHKDKWDKEHNQNQNQHR